MSTAVVFSTTSGGGGAGEHRRCVRARDHHGVGLHRRPVLGRHLHLDGVGADDQIHLLVVGVRVGVGQCRVAAIEIRHRGPGMVPHRRHRHPRHRVGDRRRIAGGGGGKGRRERPRAQAQPAQAGVRGRRFAHVRMQPGARAVHRPELEGIGGGGVEAADGVAGQARAARDRGPVAPVVPAVGAVAVLVAGDVRAAGLRRRSPAQPDLRRGGHRRRQVPRRGRLVHQHDLDRQHGAVRPADVVIVHAVPFIKAPDCSSASAKANVVLPMCRTGLT